MTRRSRGNPERLEQVIDLALNPGAFVPDRACFSFVSDLDGVAAKIAKQPTAIFCMCCVRGFEEEILGALERTRTSISRRSVHPAIGRRL